MINSSKEAGDWDIDLSLSCSIIISSFKKFMKSEISLPALFQMPWISCFSIDSLISEDLSAVSFGGKTSEIIVNFMRRTLRVSITLLKNVSLASMSNADRKGRKEISLISIAFHKIEGKSLLFVPHVDKMHALTTSWMLKVDVVGTNPVDLNVLIIV